MSARTWTALLLAALVSPGIGLGQDQESAARQASKRAQELAAAGEWRQAVEVSSSTLRQCEPGDAGRGCRLILNYTIGYVLQTQSRRQPAEAAELLAEAASHYERVLADDPDHAPSMKNLALIYSSPGASKTGAGPQSFLESAMRKDSTQVSTYARLLGDSYRGEREWESALEAYEQAAKADPHDEGARLRIVEVHRHLSASEARRLFQRLPEWERRFPEAARRGYEVVMEKAHPGDAGLAEEALVRWVALLARRRSIGLESLRALPDDWRVAAVAELHEYLENPYRRPDGSSWWMRGAERRNTLAAVGLALGTAKLADGEVGRTEACWNVALEVALPGVSLLELRGELASLYSRYPNLDPDGEKFEAIENELFRGKGAAYGEEDLDAIQRYHTVLGIIYAEKGVWTSSRYARNGIFQIEHALETAARRDARDGTYQPLAYLKSRLAEGYAATGESVASARTHVEAVAAYLDSDDLEGASRSLARARELGASGERVAALGTLTELRVELGRTDARAGVSLCAVERLAEAFTRLGDRDLRRDFVTRQRFKALSDCAALATGRARAELASEALAIAAEADLALVGARDLTRLESARLTVRELLGLEPVETKVGLGEGSGAARSLALSLPGTVEAAYVAVEPSTVLAGRIVEALRPGEAGLRLDIHDDGRVTILEVGGALDEQAVRTAIRKVEGVREVRVRADRAQRIDAQRIDRRVPPP